MTDDDDGDGDGDDDPHAGRGVVSAGAPRGAAEAAVVALHGRGATAQGVVNLAAPLARHGVAVVAPEAERSRWWPYASREPLARNEPHVSSALRAVDRALGDVTGWGVDPGRVVLFGFSQGASLACEYAARRPRRDGRVDAGAVRATATVLRDLDASVTERVADGVGHAVTDDDLAAAGELVAAVLPGDG